MKKYFLATAFVALASVSAQAADIVTDAMHDWSGLYAGLNAGYGFGGDDDVGVLPGGNVGRLEVNGIFGGGQIGFNYQMDQVVIGLEGDIQLADINDSDANFGFTMNSDVNYFGTVRARAGFAVDNALIYATGGLAYAGIDYKVQGGPPGININDSYSKMGYAVGGGVEYAFDDNWSGKVEYLYVGLGHKDLSDIGFTTRATPSFHSVRLGINYKF